MISRVFMVLLTMALAIGATLFAAKESTGPNTVSFDEPDVLWLTIGIVAVLFFPPLILSFFNHLAVKVISAVYQAFITLSFLSLILPGILIPSLGFIVIGIVGSIVSICSIIVTILIGLKNN